MLLFHTYLASLILLKLLHFYSADALVNTGLAKLGYEYVNIGMDCDLNPISYDVSYTE